MEVLSGAADGGEEALGVHDASIHDIVAYDVDPHFGDNNNSCCTLGWFVKLESSSWCDNCAKQHHGGPHSVGPDWVARTAARIGELVLT